MQLQTAFYDAKHHLHALMRTQVQVQTTVPGDAGHLSALQMLRSVSAQGGLRSLYHGLGVTLLRDAPSYGLYFVVFEVRNCLYDVLTPNVCNVHRAVSEPEPRAYAQLGTCAHFSCIEVAQQPCHVP